MSKLAPSLLSANFANLEKDIKTLNNMDVKYLHLDVMDGSFVPNISFGPGLIKSLRPLTQMVFDTHLMIGNPEDFVEDFANAGSDILTVHYECANHLDRLIKQIKDAGMKAGLSLNPATPLGVLDYIAEDLDLVLLMSVNPGFGGQSFIEKTKRKIKELSDFRQERSLDFLIEVDGGIKTDIAKEVKDMGADLLVAGSDVFKAPSIEDRISQYKEILND